MANLKTTLSDPNTQFTQVRARGVPDDSREMLASGVATLAGAAGKGYARGKAGEMAGADMSLEEVHDQATLVENEIEAGLSSEQNLVEGPLSKERISEIKDAALTEFSHSDRTLKALRDRGVISTVEANARRQLNLQRQLANPITSMFRDEFLDTASDISGGSKGAAGSWLDYTPEEQAALDMAEAKAEKEQQYEAKVHELTLIGIPDDLARDQIYKEEQTRIKLAEYEAKKAERDLTSFEVQDSAALMQNSATRGITVRVNALLQSTGKEGLGPQEYAAMTRDAEYQYQTQLEQINAAKVTPDVRKAMIESLKTWKTGIDAFVDDHKLGTLNKDRLEYLKQNTTLKNYEEFPFIMAMTDMFPDFGKFWFERMGYTEQRLIGIMGEEKYNSYKNSVGDIYGSMGKFQAGEETNPEAIAGFNNQQSMEYLVEKAAEDKNVRANLAQAYHDASEISLRNYNQPFAPNFAKGNPEFKGEVGRAASIVRQKIDSIKERTGNTAAVLRVHSTAPTYAQAMVGDVENLSLDIPSNMKRHKGDIIELYKTVRNHTWAWEHVADQYIDAADAFNGFMRGEWEFNTGGEAGRGVGKVQAERPVRGQELETPRLPTPEEEQAVSEQIDRQVEANRAIRERDRTVERGEGMPVSPIPNIPEQNKVEIGRHGDTNWATISQDLFKYEGGFQADPEDRGNYYEGKLIGTNKGISAAQYKKLFGSEPTKEKLMSLTDEQVQEAYKKHYWDKNKVGQMPPELQDIVMNMYVMTSPKEVTKAIQRASGAKEDGIMGPQTLKAMRGVSKEEIWEEYHKYLKSLKNYSKHGEGWRSRYEQILNT